MLRRMTTIGSTANKLLLPRRHQSRRSRRWRKSPRQKPRVREKGVWLKTSTCRDLLQFLRPWLKMRVCLLLAVAAEDSCFISLSAPYRRPAWLPELHPSKLSENLACWEPPCSEQVHLQLAGVEKIAVSFASFGNANSLVVYGVKRGFECQSSDLTSATHGTSEQYSQLMRWSHELWAPSMGEPTLTPAEVARIRSMEWCQDQKTGWKYRCYHSYTEDDVDTLRASGRYSNPHEHYDSPELHTVVLEDLQPDQAYCYRVYNDQRIFEFKTPKASPVAFPFKMGLSLGPSMSYAHLDP